MLGVGYLRDIYGIQILGKVKPRGESEAPTLRFQEDSDWWCASCTPRHEKKGPGFDPFAVPGMKSYLVFRLSQLVLDHSLNVFHSQVPKGPELTTIDCGLEVLRFDLALQMYLVSEHKIGEELFFCCALSHASHEFLEELKFDRSSRILYLFIPGHVAGCGMRSDLFPYLACRPVDCLSEKVFAAASRSWAPISLLGTEMWTDMEPTFVQLHIEVTTALASHVASTYGKYGAALQRSM